MVDLYPINCLEKKRGRIMMIKKNIKENYSSLLTLAILFVLLSIISNSSVELLFRIILSVLLIFIANPILALVERITGNFGKKAINKYTFWGMFFLIVFLSLTL